MSTLPDTVAILTGDLVKSSELPTEVLRGIPGTMSDIARSAQQDFGRSVAPRMIDVFRGDSWQWLVTEPKRALRLAVYLRAALRGRFPNLDIDTRVSIGIGPVEALPPTRVSQGLGPAFETSGRALETMPKRRRLVLARASDSDAPELEDGLVGLIDWLATGWTSAQARAISGALAGKTQETIAGAWEPAVTQSVVARHLARAGWEPLASALSTYELAAAEARNPDEGRKV